jgi:hypothetical protein
MNILNYVNDASIFKNEEEKNDFKLYCEYMMFSNLSEPYPILKNKVLPDYFKPLYKYVDMQYVEDMLKQIYN